MGQKLSLYVEAPLKCWKNKHKLEERQNVISLNILVHKTHLKHWDICKRKISNNCNVNYRHMPCKFFLKSHRYACLLESSQLCATFRHLGMENNWASIASIYEIHCKRQPYISWWKTWNGHDVCCRQLVVCYASSTVLKLLLHWEWLASTSQTLAKSIGKK